MEVILNDDIKGLGYKHDTVTVKPGYGRNYLIPQGHAILANKSNRMKIDELIKQRAHKAAKLQGDAQSIADEIGELVLNINAKAGESGKIFGAVTSLQVSDALAAKGFEVDRKKISFEQIKSLGQYEAELDLHKAIQHKITLNVIEG
jgi:large subunit ribosomal protein L9